MDGKKRWKKTGLGILFVAACFASMYILMEYHDSIYMVAGAAALLLLTSFLFLDAVFSDRVKKQAPEEEKAEQETATEEFSGTAADFQNRIFKHMQETESIQKELLNVLKNQNTLLQTQIENLEHEIYMLSEKQVNQAKSIIKFNKENARQLAISERETLEYVMSELKQAIEDNAGAVPVRVAAEASVVPEIPVETKFEVPEMPAAEPAVEPSLDELFAAAEVPVEMPVEPFMEEIPAAEPLEEPSLEDLFQMDEPAAEEVAIPEMSEDIDLSQLFDMNLLDEPAVETAAEPLVEEPVPVPVVEEPVPVVEEKPEEPAPAADPLAGLGSDPNAMMTPEDIAKLLASMGQ